MARQTIVHTEEHSGRPSLVSDLVKVLWIRERQSFTTSELMGEFLQISCNILTKLIQASLAQILYVACSENAHSCEQNTENGFLQIWLFLQQYHKDGNIFHNHILEQQVMKQGFHFGMLKPKNIQSSVCTHIIKQAEKNAVCLPENWKNLMNWWSG